VPTGFSIAHDAVFTEGTIQQGTLNSVALSGNTLTDGASTNISTVTNATLRALTLNITPGATFTNSSAADFRYNIVQPSIQPTLTTGSIPAQSTLITGSTDIDLRNYFTNGKFFEITSDSATSSLISASIVSGYILRLTGQGSCNDITGTTSAGSIVVAAFNEKATVDGSVAGSTASTSVVEKGSAFVSATVNLNVTACAQNASLTMSLNSSSSTLDGCTIPTGTTSTEVFEIASAGSSFTNKMQFTISKPGTTLTTNMINVSTTSGFTPVLTANNVGTVTLGFSGTYPNLAVNANVNYTFTLNISTTATYTSAIGLTMSNAGYSSNTAIISATSSSTGQSHNLSTATITASAGNFTSAPTVFYANETATGSNYIKVTTHNKPSGNDAEASNPFYLTTTNPTSTTIAITGKAYVAVGDTSGSANVVLVPEGVTNTVNSITVGGVQKNSTSSSHTHRSVNGIESPITFVVAATGAISYSLANVSMGSVTLSLSQSTSNGSATVTVSLPSATSSGSFDFIASPTGGTAWTVSVTHTKETLTLGSMYRLKLTNAGYANTTAVCNASLGTKYAYYETTADDGLGDPLYVSDEAARGGVGDQSGYISVDIVSGATSTYAGSNGAWYKGQDQRWNGVAYVDIGSCCMSYFVSNSNHPSGEGIILEKHFCS